MHCLHDGARVHWPVLALQLELQPGHVHGAEQPNDQPHLPAAGTACQSTQRATATLIASLDAAVSTAEPTTAIATAV